MNKKFSRSKKAVAAVTLAIGLSLGGAVSARAIEIAQILHQINNLSNQLSQGLQTFTDVQNIASLLGLTLKTTSDTVESGALLNVVETVYLTRF